MLNKLFCGAKLYHELCKKFSMGQHSVPVPTEKKKTYMVNQLHAY